MKPLLLTKNSPHESGERKFCPCRNLLRASTFLSKTKGKLDGNPFLLHSRRPATSSRFCLAYLRSALFHFESRTALPRPELHITVACSMIFVFDL